MPKSPNYRNSLWSRGHHTAAAMYFGTSALVLLMMLVPAWGGSCREAKLCCTGRDSSCVVQKGPLNTIVEDLDGIDADYLNNHHHQPLLPPHFNNLATSEGEEDEDGVGVEGVVVGGDEERRARKQDKPCYCDHACLKLGDCCTDFKDACGVVDCQVTAWGPWSPCDVECGAGTMSRGRTIRVQPQNGGRHCPSLEQRRGCQVTTCQHHPDAAIKEIAMLLPGNLSRSRTANATSDIRKNLRLRDPETYPQYDPEKTYCVQFEVLKAAKACKREANFESLQEGEKVCVRCESDALHQKLGWRCQGHGVQGRITRFTALSAPHCHGKWIRLDDDPAKNKSCTGGIDHQKCDTEHAFIFV